MKFSRLTAWLLLALVSTFLFAGCVKDSFEDNREKVYGYAQFKLYKSASYGDTKATVSQMQYLHDAAKVMVMLKYGDTELSQTLVLSAADDAAAEFGLRSEKLQLLAGEYEVTSFTLYDKVDEELYYGNASGSFSVAAGGLSVHDLLADVTPRGKVRFTLVKDFLADTKAARDEYTFDEIRYVDLVVKETSTGFSSSFKNLPADFSLHFNEDDDIEDG